MTETEEKKQKEVPQSFKEVLAFSARLRRDLFMACMQIENGLGQDDVTINKEVEVWLSR